MNTVIFKEVLKLVAHPLAQAGGIVGPGIVAGGMHGEIGELAGVPGSDPFALERRRT